MNSSVTTVTVGEIRIAPLSLPCLDAVVEIHIAAFPDYMNAQLGRGYLWKFLEGFLTGRDTIALLAMSESGQVLGYVVGAPIDASRAMSRAVMPAAFFAIMCRPWLLISSRIRTTAWERLRLLRGGSAPQKIEPVLPPPTLSLVSIAVDPQTRGRGVGVQLMRAFETKAREMGSKSLRLSVYPKNLGARRFYESLAWNPFQESVPVGHAMFYSKVLMPSANPLP